MDDCRKFQETVFIGSFENTEQTGDRQAPTTRRKASGPVVQEDKVCPDFQGEVDSRHLARIQFRNYLAGLGCSDPNPVWQP